MFARLLARWENTYQSIVVAGGVMKLINLLLLGLMLAGATCAQTASNPSDPPGVSVTRFSWHKDLYVPALFDDPMSPNQEQADLKREQRAIKKANAVRTAGGQGPLPIPTREIAASQRDIPEGPSISYIYEAKLKNVGEKTIKGVVWEYLLFDPETVTQIGRHQFIDVSKIRPGKTGNLLGYATTPPASILQAQKAGKDSPKYTERVVINRVEYDDGSFWQRPLN
jgi:hypothetical protein